MTPRIDSYASLLRAYVGPYWRRTLALLLLLLGGAGLTLLTLEESRALLQPARIPAPDSTPGTSARRAGRWA